MNEIAKVIEAAATKEWQRIRMAPDTAAEQRVGPMDRRSIPQKVHTGAERRNGLTWTRRIARDSRFGVETLAFIERVTAAICPQNAPDFGQNNGGDETGRAVLGNGVGSTPTASHPAR